ncbi:hypothetical protein GCM10010222_17600 [Streptomyces tanashiensis]|nr:hypothetical protein GCM10010222_17600 [Streptomyces tanashiensis]
MAGVGLSVPGLHSGSSHDAGPSLTTVERGVADVVEVRRGACWRTEGGLDLDTEAHLGGLEKAARTHAEVAGKHLPREH